jgi:hypothetical protein
MTMIKMAGAAVVLTVFVACSTNPEAQAPHDEGASHPPGPVGTKLVRDVSESSQAFVIGATPGAGLRGQNVKVNGAPVWPPRGDHCDSHVKCCAALADLADSLALSCLLATARDRDCKTAMTTSVSIAQEQSYPLPGVCKQ